MMKLRKVLLATTILITTATCFGLLSVRSQKKDIVSKIALDKLLPSERNTIKVVEQNLPSVVNVTNIRTISRQFGLFGKVNSQKAPAGAGTGFVWDKKGHIVTNYHVIQGGDEFIVNFKDDKTEYQAEVVGAEPEQDIAVLKLKKMPKELRPVSTGQSSTALRVGQKAMAIGNPFGLDHSLSVGVISALGRSIEGIGRIQIRGMIQTDASINPGNSGGILLNSLGEVVGMNTMIFSKSGSSAGVGFAVPIDSVKRAVPQLIKYGKVKRPAIGVAILDEYYYRFFGIKEGVALRTVMAGGPADKAGLRGVSQTRDGYKVGDVITEINNSPIKSFDDLYYELGKYKIGEQVEITYYRGRKKRKTKLKLTELKRPKR